MQLWGIRRDETRRVSGERDLLSNSNGVKSVDSYSVGSLEKLDCFQRLSVANALWIPSSSSMVHQCSGGFKCWWWLRGELVRPPNMTPGRSALQGSLLIRCTLSRLHPSTSPLPPIPHYQFSSDSTLSFTGNTALTYSFHPFKGRYPP